MPDNRFDSAGIDMVRHVNSNDRFQESGSTGKLWSFHEIKVRIECGAIV